MTERPTSLDALLTHVAADLPDEEAEPWTSTEYIEPNDRPAAWTALAAELAENGMNQADIAYALCVDELTVTRLLAGELDKPGPSAG